MTSQISSKHVYGFVGWIASFVLFGLYLIWACPDSLLHQYGITYYPNKYWAVAWPLFLFSCMWWIVLFHNAIIFTRTVDIESTTLIKDSTTASLKRRPKFGPFSTTKGPRPVARDLYIGDVNRMQFGD